MEDHRDASVFKQSDLLPLSSKDDCRGTLVRVEKPASAQETDRQQLSQEFDNIQELTSRSACAQESFTARQMLIPQEQVAGVMTVSLLSFAKTREHKHWPPGYSYLLQTGAHIVGSTSNLRLLQVGSCRLDVAGQDELDYTSQYKKHTRIRVGLIQAVGHGSEPPKPDPKPKPSQPKPIPSV
jgi:hypothetical protein